MRGHILAARGMAVFFWHSSCPPGEGESGCRDGVPAGGLGAKPLRFFPFVKNTFL